MLLTGWTQQSSQKYICTNNFHVGERQMTRGPEDSWMKIFTNTKTPHEGKDNKTTINKTNLSSRNERRWTVVFILRAEQAVMLHRGAPQGHTEVPHKATQRCPTRPHRGAPQGHTEVPHKATQRCPTRPHRGAPQGHTEVPHKATQRWLTRPHRGDPQGHTEVTHKATLLASFSGTFDVVNQCFAGAVVSLHTVAVGHGAWAERTSGAAAWAVRTGGAAVWAERTSGAAVWAVTTSGAAVWASENKWSSSVGSDDKWSSSVGSENRWRSSVGSENGWNSNGENRWSREIATHLFHQRHSANAFYVVTFSDRKCILCTHFQTSKVFYVFIFRPETYFMFSFSHRRRILCTHFQTSNVFYVFIFGPQNVFYVLIFRPQTYFMYLFAKNK